VPDVVGQEQAAAEKALAEAGFGAKTTLVFSDTVKQGLVVAQEPAGGRAARNASIALQVSKGPDVVTVPRVGGQPRDAAVQRLRAAGLDPVVQVVLRFGPGNVLRTDPGGGSKVRRGSKVTVYVF
jgi:beta-lactam-binding protein with PASTA domain